MFIEIAASIVLVMLAVLTLLLSLGAAIEYLASPWYRRETEDAVMAVVLLVGGSLAAAGAITLIT